MKKIMKAALILLAIAIPLSLYPTYSLSAQDNKCRSYNELELKTIKTSNNANMIAASGIVELIIDPLSTDGKYLLDLGSQIESPKGMATVSKIIHQLSEGLTLQLLRNKVKSFYEDNKDNALAYYIEAIQMLEAGEKREIIAVINNGNKKNFNGFSRQRFNAITEAAKMAGCSWRIARQHAFWNSHNGALYYKLNRLCRKLINDYKQDARTVCYLMGEKLEKGSMTCIEQLQSLAIQNHALSEISSQEKAIAAINIRRARALACGGLDKLSISENDVPETADFQYYQIMLDKGEAAAQEFIADFIKKNKY
jgi:hypothetical protein